MPENRTDEHPFIQRIAVLGAGAVGAAYATQIFDAPGLEVQLVADGERRRRLQRDGLVVNGRPYHLPVLDPAAAGAPADLILVALKHHQLPAALTGLHRLVGDNTLFLSVMNGLESEALIGAQYGMEKLLYAITVGIDALREGNRVRYSQLGKIHFGEAQNREISPRVRAVQAAFDRAGIGYETPADMMRTMWWKFMINVGVNQASAVMRAPYAVFQTQPAAQAVMEALMAEVVALAETCGVDLRRRDITEWHNILRTLSPQGKTSMLQDVEAGRKTEVDIFGGKVVALGAESGVPTPVNRTLWQIIQVLEASSDQSG